MMIVIRNEDVEKVNLYHLRMLPPPEYRYERSCNYEPSAVCKSHTNRTRCDTLMNETLAFNEYLDIVLLRVGAQVRHID